METFFLSFVVMVLVMLAMAVGLIVGKKPIKGTCASLSNLNPDGECVVCGKKPDEQSDCDADSPAVMKQKMFYAADADYDK